MRRLVGLTVPEKRFVIPELLIQNLGKVPYLVLVAPTVP